MKPRHNGLPADCRAISDVLARVGDKWSVLVVTRLGERPLRFNEMRRAIGGISQRMLTLTLRGLERDGLVTRTVFATIPPRVDYALTPLGRDLLSRCRRSARGRPAIRPKSRARARGSTAIARHAEKRRSAIMCHGPGLSNPPAAPRSSNRKRQAGDRPE